MRKDFLAHLLDLPECKKLQFVKETRQAIPRLEQLIGEKLSKFLGFEGDLYNDEELFVKYSDKTEDFEIKDDIGYLGQWSKETKKPHGRGIRFQSDGGICICYMKNGKGAPGNFIWICNDMFVIGDRYIDHNGKHKDKRTRYFYDGRTEQVDD